MGEIRYVVAGLAGLVLSAWPGPSEAFEPRAQANLLSNEGFDQGVSGPAGWGFAADVNPGAAYPFWVPTSFVSVGHAVQTRMYANGQADWRQLVPSVQSNLRYRLRAHVFASNVAAGSHGVEVQWFGAGGAYLGRHVAASTVAGTWAEVTSDDVTPPEGATSAYLLLRSYQTGLYRFDDVVFGPRDENLAAVAGGFPLVLYDLPSRELLVNGSFTQVVESATALPNQLLPGAWGRWVDTGTSTQAWVASCSLSPCDIQRGPGALVTHPQSPGQSDWRQFVSEVDPSLSYCLGGTIAADNVAPGSHGITVVWVDSGGQVLGHNVISSDMAGVPRVVSTCGLLPPAGTTGAWVLLRSYQLGEYHFDDVSLAVDRTAAEWYGEVAGAGFSQIFADVGAFDAVGAAGLQASFAIDTSLPHGEDPGALIARVDAVTSHPALATLHTVDEPAWDPEGGPSPVPAPWLVGGYEALHAGGEPLPPIWLNHAPRGTGQHPDDFERLLPYMQAADIVSFDIYPVPSGWGHSILPEQGPGSVGAHADLLHELLSEQVGGVAAQRKPLWMVLQGLGWSDLVDPARVLEHGVEVHWFDASDEYLGREVLSSPTPNRWRTVVHQSFESPAGASYAWVLLRAYRAGDYAFDDVRFGQVGGPDDLLGSGGFEGHVEGSGQSAPAGWFFEAEPGGDAVPRWGGGPALSGGAALHIQMRRHGQADWRRLVQHVEGSKRYTLSGAVYARTRPTLAETRFMAYDAIIHGARGLAYWGTRFVPATAPLWHDLRAVAFELRELSPALLLPTSFRRVSATAAGQPAADVETLLLGTGPGPLYLLAANRGTAPLPALSFSVSGLPLRAAARIGGGPSAIASNAFSDAIEPYGVRVYVLE